VRILVQGQPGQEVCESSSQLIAGHRGAYLSYQTAGSLIFAPDKLIYKIVCETPSQQITWDWWHTSIIPMVTGSLK
jgi:hypothetical protein